MHKHWPDVDMTNKISCGTLNQTPPNLNPVPKNKNGFEPEATSCQDFHHVKSNGGFAGGKALLRAAQLELSKPQAEAIIHHWFQQKFLRSTAQPSNERFLSFLVKPSSQNAIIPNTASNTDVTLSKLRKEVEPVEISSVYRQWLFGLIWYFKEVQFLHSHESNKFHRKVLPPSETRQTVHCTRHQPQHRSESWYSIC